MIPKQVLKVVYIFKMRIEVPHNVDDMINYILTFFFFWYANRVLY